VLAPVAWVAAGALGLLLAALAGGLLGAVRLSRGRLKEVAARVRPLRALVDALASASPAHLRDPRALVGAVVLQAGVILFDAATMETCLRAVEVAVPFSTAFATFQLAFIAGTFGVTPGGLGAFEAASVWALHAFGVPVERALAGTLLFRGLTYWLPMVPGFWIWRRSMSR